MRVAACFALLVIAQAVIEADKVKTIPGAPEEPNFDMYSGFLSITNDKALHYVFVTSQDSTNGKDQPVVLWLNGGPGCSSMDGFYYENGPYVFPYNSKTLEKNEYAWNMKANMIYFESPAGVGFSTYGNNPQNLNTNDMLSAQDNIDALAKWFEGFDEFRANDFYIAGESYGGIYVPYLANYTLTYNAENPDTKINLKGFLVGNGVTEWSVDATNALPKFTWSHDIIGYNTHKLFEGNNCDAFAETQSQPCQDAFNQMNTLMKDVNIYDIYKECDMNGVVQDTKQYYTPWLEHARLREEIPCVDDLGVTNYLNNATVREALNIPANEGAWSVCTDQLNYTMNFKLGSYYLYEKWLLNAGLKVQIYSGDVDAAVPVTGTMAWLHMLNLTPKPDYKWRQWSMGGQVSGFTIDFQELSFTTIKGTGHMSIQWKRPEGFRMFNCFLNGTDISVYT